MTDTPTILRQIIARKHEEIALRQGRSSIAELRSRAGEQAPARGFVRALARRIEKDEAADASEGYGL